MINDYTSVLTLYTSNFEGPILENEKNWLQKSREKLDKAQGTLD